MRKKISLYIIIFLLFVSPFILCMEGVSAEASSEDIIEIEEGVYQVIENEQYGTSEYGTDNVYSVDESSPGYDSGEDNLSESGNDSGSEEKIEGSGNSSSGTTETNQNINGENEYDISYYFLMLHDDLITLNETLFKIMISIWALAGMILGTKLIKGMFGYG